MIVNLFIMNALEVRKFREKFNLTQTQLAEYLGTSVRAIQSWEQGVRNITESSVKLIEMYQNQHNVSQCEPKTPSHTPNEPIESKTCSPESTYSSKEDRLLKIIESQQKTIERLTEMMAEKKPGAYMAARVAGAG
jgi:transcriptional regulator with XRE-family HTH domain